MEDAQFIEQVLAGNRDAFRFLVIRYQKPLFRFIAGFGLQPALVDEVAQETFLRAYKNLVGFDPQLASFSSWLFTIAKNATLNEIAKAKTHHGKLHALEKASLESGESPHGALEARVESERVRKALQGLPEAFRSALTLSYLQELSLEEIADIENCPIGTIKSRIFRAKKLLYDQLQH